MNNLGSQVDNRAVDGSIPLSISNANIKPDLEFGSAGRSTSIQLAEPAELTTSQSTVTMLLRAMLTGYCNTLL